MLVDNLSINGQVGVSHGGEAVVRDDLALVLRHALETRVRVQPREALIVYLRTHALHGPPRRSCLSYVLLRPNTRLQDVLYAGWLVLRCSYCIGRDTSRVHCSDANSQEELVLHRRGAVDLVKNW